MRLLQVHHRVPAFDDTQHNLDLGRHIKKTLREMFYENLHQLLAESPGGALIAQPKVTERREHDWLLATGDTIVYGMSAMVEELPLPPEYRLIGGPADGRIIRTRGERIWLVAVAPPPPTLASYLDETTVPRLVAEYERQGDTSAYFYRRTTEA